MKVVAAEDEGAFDFYHKKNTRVRFDSRVFSFVQRQNDRLNKNESAGTGRHIYCNIRMFASLHFHGYIRNKLQRS